MSAAAALPTEKEVKEGVWKLMDQAGKHPKLTPKIVRSQLERKLGVQTGSLKVFRPLIKKVIFAWWLEAEDDNGSGDDASAFALQALISLAKAAGKFPAVLKGISEGPEEKVKELRKR